MFFETAHNILLFFNSFIEIRHRLTQRNKFSKQALPQTVFFSIKKPPCFQYGQVIDNKKFFLNLKGTFLFYANKEAKYREKVWLNLRQGCGGQEKKMEFRRRLRLCRDKLMRIGKRTDPAKSIFLIKYQPYREQSQYIRNYFQLCYQPISATEKKVQPVKAAPFLLLVMKIISSLRPTS